MSPWPFVIAAYAVAILSTLCLILWAVRSARRAEAALDAVAAK